MKIKKWVKDNKKKIAKIAAITAGGVAAVIIGKKVLKKAFSDVQVPVPVQSIPIKGNSVKVPEQLDVCIDNRALQVIVDRGGKTAEELTGIINTVKEEIGELPENGIGIMINDNLDNTLGFQYLN